MISSKFTNGKLEMFGVFYVDMKSSTFTTAGLRPESYAFYYTAFYDTLSDIALKFGGRVIKHVGDALIIYFPATSDPSNANAFKSMLDCGMAMLDSQRELNNMFLEENLPPLCYRISADYGRMEPIETTTSPGLDWIGPSMNMVAKMNRLALTNSMVIGGDLQQILSKFSFQDYFLDFAGELSIGIKQTYPIFAVTRRKTNNGVISSSVTPAVNLAKNGKGTEGNAVNSGIPNIVIIDDEQDILLVYKQFLSGQRVNVEVFSDPTSYLGDSRLSILLFMTLRFSI